jgi:mannose-6-phosphate isomerase-like protein (cupin superfamily)
MRIIRGSEIKFIPASHEDQERPGVLKRVLATRDELIDGRVQMINWASLPAGSAFRAHYHEDMEEVFIILTGRVEMTVNDVSNELSPGDAIVISPREVHTMKNLTDQDLEYIVMGISTGEGGQTVVVDE